VVDRAALEEFPRQLARTRRFSLGIPRGFRVSPDGERVVFLRTRAGDDPVSCLWSFDLTSSTERCLVDPRELASLRDEPELTEAERARRERAREHAEGITAFEADDHLRRAVFVLSTRLYLADLIEGGARELPAAVPVDGPRIDPQGTKVAYVSNGALHVLEIDGADRVLAEDPSPDVTWGLPEFIAAEEMRRFQGSWWSPDGSRLAAARVDESRVRVWHIFDATDPASAPRAVRYPQAGTDDAEVTLHVFEVATGERVEVSWDRTAFPYLARVCWSDGSPLTILVQTRDQRTTRLLEVDAATGSTGLVREEHDEQWIDLAEEAPVRLDGGRLVTVVADRSVDTNRLAIDFEPVTPPGLQVHEVLSAGEGVLFTASEDPTESHVWRWTDAGLERFSRVPGVHGGAEGGDTTVLASSTLEDVLPVVRVVRGGERVGEIACVAERSVITPKPGFLELGERALRAALFLPDGREPDGKLPVLMDPYGGPHFARVSKALGAHLESQWFADHGFAVLVVDGRGTPGRGPAWDREMYRDFTIALDDQVDALHAAAERYPFLDLSRVGIRGWSFGGELAAMAILRRPDVFHAAVAGAPVTLQELYDTHYTERYLGHPAAEPEVYRRNSVLWDADKLERPLLLIHGLSDDNVYVAHTLRLSAALFEAGRYHELVLLPNATHMTRSDAVTENVLRIQLDFLRRSLGLGRD
jgi:dipeptidyl-peptidase-4